MSFDAIQAEYRAKNGKVFYWADRIPEGHLNVCKENALHSFRKQAPEDGVTMDKIEFTFPPVENGRILWKKINP